MKRLMAGALVLIALLTGPGAATAHAAAAHAAATGILARLNAIPGMSAAEHPSTIPGQRWFRLTFRQPVDHRDPEGPWSTPRPASTTRSTAT